MSKGQKQHPKEKPLNDEQNMLMSLVAKEAVVDWGEPERWTRYRVMTRAVIREGNRESLNAVRVYYGLRALKSDGTVESVSGDDE